MVASALRPARDRSLRNAKGRPDGIRSAFVPFGIGTLRSARIATCVAVDEGQAGARPAAQAAFFIASLRLRITS